MFAVLMLFGGIFILWIVATGKAFQIVQILGSPVRRQRSSVNNPNIRSSGSIGGTRR